MTPTGMTAVLGGDRDEVLATLDKHGLTAANDNGPGQIVAAGTLEQLEALAADPPAKARLTPLSVAGAFHTEHMAPAVGHLAGLARSVSVHDPRTPADLQQGRPGGPRRAGGAGPDRRPDRQPGPLGPLHGDDARPRRHRDARDAAGRHPDRHRQAGHEGRRDLRAEDPRPARRRPRVRREARRGVPDRDHADLADDRLPRQGHLPPRGRGRRPRAPRSGRPRSATSPAFATGSTSSPRTAGRSSSGSSRTATWSPPASRSCACTPREPPDEPRSPAPPARSTPRSSASAATGRPG